MPPRLAAFCCGLFILWLFWSDAKRRHASFALWIPLLWAFILGSKPFSLWFGYGDEAVGPDGYVEGSPFDRLVFLLLIAAGWVVITRRHISWSSFFSNNRWLCIYFAYLGVSVLWSDYSFVSSKRWIKDFGNVIMVLVVLTEKEPLIAVKTLLLRCAYLLIPLSVVLVKYYPDLGRYYDRWTYQPYFCGPSTDKNLFGMLLFVFGLPMLWLLLETRSLKGHVSNKREFYILLFLTAMMVWLLKRSQSSTAISCTVLGAVTILAMKIPTIRRGAHLSGAYAISLVMLLIFLNTTFKLGGALVRLVGRDLTLTGRTDIWSALLKEDVNPLIGVGFNSFWMGDRVERLSEKYYYALNEAHNGYLETYLNSGLIGVLLLLILLFSAANKIGKEVRSGSNYGVLRLAFLVTIVVYGMTEAVFRFGPIWFVLLLMLTEYPHRRHGAADSKDDGSRERKGLLVYPHLPSVLGR